MLSRCVRDPGFGLTMRFKAHFCDITLFSRLVQTVEKSCKQCIVHFAPRGLYLHISEDQAEGRVEIHGFVKKDTLFTSYRLESQADNNIAMTIEVNALSRAVKSCNSAEDVVVRLSKKNGQPFLSLDMTDTNISLQHSADGKSIKFTQDIPIEVIGTQETLQLKVPDVVDCDIIFALPLPKLISSVVDKMKSIGSHLTMEINNEGSFTVRVDRDDVEVTTTYRNLQVTKPLEENEDFEQDSNGIPKLSVSLDIKSVAKMLHCHILQPTDLMCLVGKQTTVAVYVLIDDDDLPNNRSYLVYSMPKLL